MKHERANNAFLPLSPYKKDISALESFFTQRLHNDPNPRENKRQRSNSNGCPKMEGASVPEPIRIMPRRNTSTIKIPDLSLSPKGKVLYYLYISSGSFSWRLLVLQVIVHGADGQFFPSSNDDQTLDSIVSPPRLFSRCPHFITSPTGSPLTVGFIDSVR